MKTKLLILYLLLVSFLPVARSFALAPLSKKSIYLTAFDWFGHGVSEEDKVSGRYKGSLADELGINETHNVLFIGVSANYVIPVACAIRGAKVDMVQPANMGMFFQNSTLKDFIKFEREMMEMSDFKRDLIGDRLTLHETILQQADLGDKTYDYIFVMGVFDDPKAIGKNSLYDSILLRADNNARIIISTVTGDPSSEAKKFMEYFADSQFSFSLEEPIYDRSPLMNIGLNIPVKVVKNPDKIRDDSETKSSS